MEKQVHLDVLNLEQASRIIGAHLRIENLMQEMGSYFKKITCARKIRFLLWDESKKEFSFEMGDAAKPAFAKPSLKGNKLLKVMSLKEPQFSPQRIMAPLRANNKLLGILILEPGKPLSKTSFDKERFLLSVKNAATAIANAQLFMESEKRNQDLFRLNVLSRALNPTVEDESIVRILAEGLEGIINFDTMTLAILGKLPHTLHLKARKALSDKTLEAVKKSLMEVVFNLTKMPIDAKEMVEKISMPQGRKSGGMMKSFLHAPLITKDKIIGVVVLNSFGRNAFSVRDQQNLSMLAAQAAVAFENSMLYSDLRRTYFSIVMVLTQAIEAKDPYTRGHSVLVSKYASALAAKMGLSASMVESIEIAGLLHDLGKIGIPEEILLKNGKLTDGEYEVVKTHSAIALKILGSVEFPHFSKEEKSLEVPPEITLNLFGPADLSSDIKLMIYHHHEKYGGAGYPKGIKKDEIPLGARILAVADTFEALTADRPYRRAFPLENAKNILRKISGEQLDPAIVKIFLGMLNIRWFKELKKKAMAQ